MKILRPAIPLEALVIGQRAEALIANARDRIVESKAVVNLSRDIVREHVASLARASILNADRARLDLSCPGAHIRS
jgi:hypothetical protein